MLKQMGLEKVAYFYAAVFAAAVVVARLGGVPNLFTSHPLTAADAAVRAGLGVAAGGAMAALWMVLAWWSPRFRGVDASLAALVGPLSPGEALLLAGLSGLAEEALFRGALQPLVGLPLASLLFMGAHVPPQRGLWPWTLTAGVMGLAMGAAAQLSGDLVVPVVMHATINAVGLARMGRRAAPE